MINSIFLKFLIFYQNLQFFFNCSKSTFQFFIQTQFSNYPIILKKKYSIAPIMLNFIKIRLLCIYSIY